MNIRKIGKNLGMIALSTGIAGSGSGCITDDPLTDYGLSELTGYMSRDTNDADASAILGGVSNVQRFNAHYNANRNIARDGATNVVINNGMSNMGKLDIVISRTVDNDVKRTFGVYMGQTDNGYVMMKTRNDGSPHPDILIRSDNIIEIIDN
ncbi:hypothetical protein COX97_04280 [Candidatus Pacearchaeota archaeon CG_4_10_14_0_2_um_filter_05_32_18]|nr:MAG: hypothetical protein COX97_04280 [Candidatus Pacearchaeota archaeon CG_4_10_14_0_2_um_filter_05_32_18]